MLVMKKILSFRSHFKDDELILINQCRIYLKVMFLSDIVSGDGKFIEENYILGKLPIDRTSQWNWPFQNRPSDMAWSLWRKALHLVWKVDSACRQCYPALGQWTAYTKINMKWLFWNVRR